MRNLCLAACLLLCSVLRAQDHSEYNASIKIGGGYAHDFPGLNGYSVFTEISKPLNDRFRAAFGLKLNNMSGNPRTESVKEHTRSTTLDFNVYFVPLAFSYSEFRVGAGYSFSFYNIRRSYPVVTTHGSERTTSWPVQDKKGRASGLGLIGEYEYFIPETNVSLGLRASLFKAYDHVSFVGVFGAINL